MSDKLLGVCRRTTQTVNAFFCQMFKKFLVTVGGRLPVCSVCYLWQGKRGMVRAVYCVAGDWLTASPHPAPPATLGRVSPRLRLLLTLQGGGYRCSPATEAQNIAAAAESALHWIAAAAQRIHSKLLIVYFTSKEDSFLCSRFRMILFLFGEY